MFALALIILAAALILGAKGHAATYSGKTPSKYYGLKLNVTPLGALDANGNMQFRFTVKNRFATTLHGVAMGFSDNIRRPAGPLSVHLVQDADGALLWKIGTLRAHQSRTVTIHVAYPSKGGPWFCVTAWVKSNEVPLTRTNNTDNAGCIESAVSVA